MDSSNPIASSWRLRSHVWAGAAVLLLALVSFVWRAYMPTRNIDLLYGSEFLALCALYAALSAWECRVNAHIEDVAERIGEPMPDIEVRLKTLAFELVQAGFAAFVDLSGKRVVVFRQSSWMIVRFIRRHFGPSFSIRTTNGGENSFLMPNGEQGSVASVLKFVAEHFPHR